MKTKISKRLLSVVLVVMMLATMIPITAITANAATYSGSGGDNAYWSLDTDTGVLEITGTGDMGDYDSEDVSPWFEYHDQINEIIISEGITSITGFFLCENVTSVAIPEGATFIGDSAFSDCTSLESITIPKSVTNIIAYAFSCCDSLTDVYYGGTTSEYIANLKNNIGFANDDLINATWHFEPETEAITGQCGDNAYWSLDTETGAMTITGTGHMYDYPDDNPEWVENYGNQIKSVVISDGITGVGKNCFKGCSQLSSVTFSNTVNYIDQYAFYGCDSLTELDLTNGLVNIGRYAFADCENLETVSIPASLTLIDYYAFNNCNAITDVYYDGTMTCYVTNLANNIRLIGTTDTGLTKASWHFDAEPPVTGQCGSNAYWSFDTATGELSITGTGDMYDYSYKDPNRSPWYGYRNFIKNINIASGITSIGVYSFAYCSNATLESIPGTVTRIGNSAFTNCYAFTNIDIQYGVTTIGYCAFDGCGFTSVSIPDSVTSIEKQAFCRSKLTSVTVPDSITDLSQAVFYQCSQLSEVSLPDTLTQIGSQAFQECTALQTIEIPDSVTFIGQYAFMNTGLTSFTFPNSLTNMDAGVLRGCNSLTTIRLPETISALPASTFYYSEALKTVYIPNNITSIGASAFTNCISLKDVYYEGTKREFESKLKDNISTYGNSKGSYNKYLTNATWHYLESEVVAYDSSIAGDVATNAYVKLIDSDVNSTTKVIVTYPDTGLEKTAEYTLSQLDKVDVAGETCYKLPTHIAAKEMQRGITIKVITDGEDIIDYTYNYADYLKAIKDGDFSASVKNLAIKVANYGGKAERYFNYLASGKSYLDNSFPTTVPTKSAVLSAVANDGYSISGVGANGEKYYGSALSLESELVVKHYFQLPKGYVGTPTATGSNIVYQGMNGNLFEVDVKVNVKTINQTSTISVNGATLTYSPYTYIKKALSSSSTSENLKNVCVALYDLHASVN